MLKPNIYLSNFLLFKELEVLRFKKITPSTALIVTKSKFEYGVCPRCASKCFKIHQKRLVKIKDAPVRGILFIIQIHKRRFKCELCRKVFTEAITGIRSGHRSTERLKRNILWACTKFKSIKDVCVDLRVSPSMVYKVFYKHLEIEVKRKINYEWPKTIGIDEHKLFKRKTLKEPFVTMFVDYNHKRIRELVHGRTYGTLVEGVGHIRGRNNVKNVILDLSDTYKTFSKGYFPNAKLIADKFHVLRLLNPHLNKRRKQITGDKRTNPIRFLLLKNRNKLSREQKYALTVWLDHYPDVKELYWAKESLHKLYRCHGTNWASRILTKLTDNLAHSKLPELKTLRRTLVKWRKEILNYFEGRLTNARTEGFNRKAKLVQRMGYGYKSFRNYRLRLLISAC